MIKYNIIKDAGAEDIKSAYTNALEKSRKEIKPEETIIIKQNIFLSADNNADFSKKKRTLREHIRDIFSDSIMPAFSIIGQKPANGASIAIESTILERTPDIINIDAHQCDDFYYITVNCTDHKAVYSGELSNDNTGDLLYQSEEVFKKAEQLLQQEEMEMTNIIRQWNYIEHITKKSAIDNQVFQNYQLFNDIRAEYYKKYTFEWGYPAATGIGMYAGGIIVDFFAVKPSGDISAFPLKNPKQTNAHQYSAKVLGENMYAKKDKKSPPKFERAKVLTNGKDTGIYISGTASIIGEDTIGKGDIEKQTQTTIDNIKILITPENLKSINLPSSSNIKFRNVKAYIKYPEDYLSVEALCKSNFGEIPTICLISDICRDDLLVEIEGEAYSGA